MKKKNDTVILSPIFQEMKRFYQLGAAPLWLHPKSKRPIGNGWTTGPRKSYSELKAEFKEGMNLGVRLGTPSQIEDGKFLAVIDVDIKSSEERHKKEALSALRKITGQEKWPTVLSGRGGGSCHIYCVTKIPFKTFNPFVSPDLVKVHMPSKSPSKSELDALSEKEIKQGLRLSRAWEISFYSEGRQVVVPPSIHPDSGRAYEWSVDWDVKRKNFPVLDFETWQDKEEKKSSSRPKVEGKWTHEEFDFRPDETLDVRWLPDLSDKMRRLIVSGEWKGSQVSDRSAYLIVAAGGLLSAGLDRNGVLSILTDKSTFLGECAYDHAQTKDRRRAALWLWNYTVKRVMEERDVKSIFSGVEIEVPRELNEEETEKQAESFREERGWEWELTRSGAKGEGPPKPTLNNSLLVLSNIVGRDVFKRDSFALRDVYGMDTPWNGKAGEVMTDDDVAKIKQWLGKEWGFEPGRDVLNDTITVMACNSSFDPIRDWLDRLPKWDRCKRLDTWLAKHFEGDGEPEYLAQVFRKWMVAMVLRVYEPGAKFDWMPIFEGPQNMGKSSFGRILVGESFFLDWLPNLADKDSALSLQGMWAVEMGELASLRRNEVETVKAYLTRTVDKFRPPFGRRLIESPRRCVFYGTTNRDTYLRDETGNRRFKPVKVGALNFDQLRKDREQLFAEAKYLFDCCAESGPTLYLSGKAALFEKQIHQEKMVEDDSDLMAEVIRDFIEKYEEQTGELCLKKFRLQDLFTGIGPLGKWRFDQKSMQLATRALKKIGAESWKSHGRKMWKIELGDRF